jgi:acyl-CoA thioesterase
MSTEDDDPTNDERSDPGGAAPPTRFAADTGVERLAPGAYGAHVHPSWWIINGPNGGYVAAIVLRAIVAEVADASRRPRSLTVQYLRAPGAGPVQIDVTVERSGRTVSNVSARLSQEGRLMALALASLAVDRTAPVAFDDTPGLPVGADGSALLLPEQIPVAEVDPERDVPMRTHYDLRWALGDLPFQPRSDGAAPRARCGGWLRPAEPEPIDEIVLAAMSDAWLPPIFSRVDHPLAVPTVDLTVHFRALPSDPLDFCFAEFDSPLAADGYLVEHGRVLDRDGRLLIESRQLAVVA